MALAWCHGVDIMGSMFESYNLFNESKPYVHFNWLTGRMINYLEGAPNHIIGRVGWCSKQSQRQFSRLYEVRGLMD